MKRNSGSPPRSSTNPDVPEELRSLGVLFHQDASFYVDMRDEQAILAYVLDNLDAATQASLKDCLTKLLLRRRLTDGRLKRLWRSTGADYGFAKGLRHFLALVRDAIPD